MAAETPTEPRPRKLRVDIHLTEDARRHLRKVWRARVMREPGLTEDEIVNAAIMALAEQPADDWNGEVL